MAKRAKRSEHKKSESAALSIAEEAPTSFSLLSWLLSLFGIGDRHQPTLEEAVNELVDSREGSEESMSYEEQFMLKNMFSFGKLTVHDILVPRNDIVAAPQDISQSDLVKLFIEEEHSRIPIYAESIDHVKGFIHVKDLLPLLAKGKSTNIKHLLRNVLFVPPSQRLVDLLIKMRYSRVHMAIVLDEYGGTEGLVTIEDVLEKIIGHIEDEHDEENNSNVFTQNGKVLEVSGRMPIEELETLLETVLIEDEERENCNTVAGLLSLSLGHVPVVKETITHPAGLVMTVLDADPRRVKRVRIERIDREALVGNTAE